MNAEVEVYCPQCDGMPMLLGMLGNVAHLRCRDCGWTFSESPPKLPDVTNCGRKTCEICDD